MPHIAAGMHGAQPHQLAPTIVREREWQKQACRRMRQETARSQTQIAAVSTQGMNASAGAKQPCRKMPQEQAGRWQVARRDGVGHGGCEMGAYDPAILGRWARWKGRAVWLRSRGDRADAA